MSKIGAATLQDKKPTILFLGGGFPPPYGGMSTVYEAILPKLVSRGFNVHCQLPIGVEIRTEYQKYVNLGITIHTVPAPTRQQTGVLIKKLLQNLFQTPRLLRYIINAVNVDVMLRHETVLKYWLLSFFSDWHAVALLLSTIEIVNKFKIDIVHATDIPWYYGCAGNAIHQLCNSVKYIHTINGEVIPRLDETTKFGSNNVKLEKYINYFLTGADVLTGISWASAQLLQDVNVSPSSARVIPHTVNTNLFYPDINTDEIVQKYDLAGNKVVLFVGQIRPRKGPQLLIDAAPIILDKEPNTKFMFVGSGEDYRNTLQNRALQFNISKNVIFVDALPPSQLPAYYAACDIFAFPSFMEGLGLSQIEAMLCGKPVVASNVDAIPEVLVDGETGLLMDDLTCEALAQKIMFLLNNNELKIKFGENGRKRALKLFDIDKVVEQYADVYLEVWQR